MDKNKELFEKAKTLMPGGVSSPVRAFKSVESEPIVVQRGYKAFLYDVNQKEYVDFICSWGPLILGHNHERVISKILEALDKGLSFGITNPYEIELADLIVSNIPFIEQVRFVSTGTEAVMSAIRLARGITEKKYVVKFEGCYHGHSDSLLVSAGSGVATLSIPGSKGVPSEIASLTIAVPYNDKDAIKEVFSKYEGSIACVIVEPIAGNMGTVVPDIEWLKLLKELCKKERALLIFDEVMTGFRVSFRGTYDLFNIEPDIVCYGKIIGGGMPIGAYAAKKEIMENVSPAGSVYQAGTLSGNPIAMASGIATLSVLLETNPYKDLEENTNYLVENIEKALKEKGIANRINKAGSMFTVFFTEKEVRNYEDAKSSDTKLFGKFFRKLLEKGVLIPPSQFEAWFLSTAHTKEVLDLALEKITKGIKEL